MATGANPKRARPSRAGKSVGIVAALKVQKGTTVTNQNKKWKGKRHKVDVGDLIQFRTSMTSQYGAVGVVIGYMSNREVLVRTFGGGDSDYGPTYISVYDQTPNESYQDKNGDNIGHRMFYYSNHITSVVHRINPKPKKKRQPVKFHEVTHEELPAVLAGTQDVPEGHKVVLVSSAP